MSYDGENHDHMVRIRAEKVQRAANMIAPLSVDDPDGADVLVLGWGGTRGAILGAVQALRNEKRSIATAHLRHINPFPSNLGEVLEQYETVIVPENNTGQLKLLLQGMFLKPIQGISEMKGRSFQVHDLRDRIDEILGGGST